MTRVPFDFLIVPKMLKDFRDARERDYARELAATPLTGRKATLELSHGRRGEIEFLSEKEATLWGDDWEVSRLGAQCSVSNEEPGSGVGLEGVVRDGQIIGEVYLKHNLVRSFKAALR